MASVGIVSAVGGPIRMPQGATLERYIRTDAIPYPGFSGGPLIDTQGSVLGITTTGLVSSATLAIPAHIAWDIADTLAQQGFIKRGYLGISSQLVQLPEAQRDGRAEDHGLLIVQVDEGSPAQKGGLMLGDILVALDNHPLKDAEDLRSLLSGDRVGKTIPSYSQPWRQNPDITGNSWSAKLTKGKTHDNNRSGTTTGIVPINTEQCFFFRPWGDDRTGSG